MQYRRTLFMFGSLSKLRIVYFSSRPSGLTNTIAGALKEAGAEILLIVMTPGPPRRQTEAYKDVVEHKLPGIDILVTSHIPRIEPMLRELKPDLIYVTGFPWRLPADLLALPRLGSINTHPAALPKYRGPNPVFWPVMNGDTEIGLTIHRMDPEFDTGPILAQATMPIDPDWYIEDVGAHLIDLVPRVIPKAFAAVLAGEPGTPQPTEGASYAPLATEADRELDWNRPARQLRNRVRAWGMEGALGKIDGKQWIVRRARVAEESAPGAEVGSLVDLGSKGQAVQTGDGLLLLEDAEPLPLGEGARG
jgi:methionyl-tRNA formyltransferase